MRGQETVTVNDCQLGNPNLVLTGRANTAITVPMGIMAIGVRTWAVTMVTSGV